jgi:hypothetical protein
MKVKGIITLLIVIVLLSSFAVAANIYINTGKVIPGKVAAFDGKELTFVLPGADINVNIPVQKIVKISFDNTTKDGTGLILKGGINLKYAQLAAIKNGKALFSLPFGALEVNDLSNIAFVNFKNAVDMNVPNSFDFVVHPITGGEFIAKLTSVKNEVYNFQTKYGDLSIPWTQIKDIEKQDISMMKNGVLIAGDVNVGGKITSFDGTYFTLTTSYGQFRIINGSVLYAVNSKPTTSVDFSSFLQLRNGQVIAGSVSSWKNGKIDYTTPWGELKFSENDVIGVKMEKYAGIYVNTTPTNVDVQLDGNYIGKTPLKLPLALSGLHTIVLSKPGYQILEKKIYATPYMVAMLNYNLSYGNIWEKDAPMPTARAYLAAVEYGGKIYVIGGRNDNGYLNTVEDFIPGISGKAENVKSQTAAENATKPKASSTKPKTQTLIDAQAVIITPVTIGLFLNEKHDLTLTISNGNFKKTFVKKEVSSAQPVVFDIDNITPGTYTVLAVWGKHTANWSANFEDYGTNIRFMMR